MCEARMYSTGITQAFSVSGSFGSGPRAVVPAALAYQIGEVSTTKKTISAAMIT